MAQLLPGTDFAQDFRILRAIGSGGMGSVYEVEQVSTRKHRALKILANRIGDDPRAHQRFVREATVAAQIRSEHVVEVIAAGIDPASRLPWLAMELLDGLDLRRVVDLHDALSPTHASIVFTQLGHGLAAAHQAGVVHRDLKPENVFVARSHRAGADFTIKILDFGIAKLTSESVASTDTAAIGSPMWMSPEQINAEPLSARTDVWALGLLAFWALTGRVYWRAAHAPRVTVQALFAEQLFAPIEPPSVRAAELRTKTVLPDDFDDWFAGCVTRDPGHRFADAGAAIHALRSILEPRVASDEGGRPLLPPPGTQVTGPERTPLHLARPTPYGTIEGTTGQPGSDASLDTIAATDLSISDRAAPAHVATRASGSLGVEQTIDSPPASPRPKKAHPTRERSRAVRWALAAAVPAALAGAVATAVVLSWPDDDDPAPSPPTPPAETAPSVPEPLSVPPTLPTAEPTPVTMEELGPVDIEFRGWTVDGGSFVLSRTHRRPRLDADPLIELVEVRDGLTGERTELYRIAPDDPEAFAWPETIRAEIEQAQDGDAWTYRRTDLLLRQPDPERRIARGELLLEVTEIPLSSKTRLLPKNTGFEVHWFGISTLGSGLSPSPQGPRLRLQFDAHGARHDLAHVRLPFTYDEVAALAGEDDEAPSVAVSVVPHPSPGGDRSVIVVESGIVDGREPRFSEQWLLRAYGPQVRIVDAGAGPEAVRQAAATLAVEGIPVALFQSTRPQAGPSHVLHGADTPADAAVGGRIAAALGLEQDRSAEMGSLLAATVVLTAQSGPDPSPDDGSRLRRR